MNANAHREPGARRRCDHRAVFAGCLLVAGAVFVPPALADTPVAQVAAPTDEAAFFAANAGRADVVTTASGLQYQVLTQGKGRKPRSRDTVRVVYTGTLLDGRVFDRVVDRKQPLSLEVAGVIPGWAEALRLMPVHSRYRIWIPSKLAYGDEGIPGQIPPGSALVFDLELLDAY